jgi:hypothetical protein
MADLARGENRVYTGEPHCCCHRPLQRVGCRVRTRLEAFERSLLVVWPRFQTADDRRIGPEVLLYRTQATVLDRGATLDDAGDRGGLTLGRLPKSVSHERARCLRGIPVPQAPPVIGACWANRV